MRNLLQDAHPDVWMKEYTRMHGIWYVLCAIIQG